MNEEMLNSYKKRFVLVLLSTSDPLTYEKLEEKMLGYPAPDNFLKRMLASFEKQNMLIAETKDGEVRYILSHFGRRRLTVIANREKVLAKRKKQKAIIAVVCLAIVAALLVWCIFFAGLGGNQNDVSDTPQDSQIENPTSEKPKEFTYKSLSLSAEDAEVGTLILVDKENGYETEPTDLQVISENKNSFYGISSSTAELRAEALEMLNKMTEAYNLETQKTDIRITSGYRSYEDQKALYDQNNDGYDMPGHSESQTGLSITVAGREENGDGFPIKDTDVAKWLEKNCGNYGYILRYPADKKAYTGEDYRSINYRYVGLPHAKYITEQGLCLEEYLYFLKENHSFGSEPLKIDGYAVYYCEGMEIKVPETVEYTLCSDNMDGFIVTYKIPE